MNSESRLESVSQVSPRPVKGGVEHREKGNLNPMKTGSNFQLNSLGGPLEEDFIKD